MRCLSICSGIEAFSVAAQPLGWTTAAVAEIEPFPSRLLAYRFPQVPNLGDFTAIDVQTLGPIHLLVGGTPCQGFSVAGLRGGLADGNRISGRCSGVAVCLAADHRGQHHSPRVQWAGSQDAAMKSADQNPHSLRFKRGTPLRPKLKEPKMSPAEVMAKAVYDEWRSKLHDGEETLPWEECEDEQKAETIGEMRAALRALAAMRFTPSMIGAARGAYDGDDFVEALHIVTGAVLLAAAEEGETA